MGLIKFMELVAAVVVAVCLIGLLILSLFVWERTSLLFTAVIIGMLAMMAIVVRNELMHKED